MIWPEMRVRMRKSRVVRRRRIGREVAKPETRVPTLFSEWYETHPACMLSTRARVKVLTA